MTAPDAPLGDPHPQLPETHDPHQPDAELTYADVVDLVDKAQRRARSKSLITLGIVMLALVLGLWRGELADRRIDRNTRLNARNAENIERVFHEQCQLLAGGFERMNAANADIVLLLESAASQPSANPEALKRFTDDFRAKQLPIPQCFPPPTVPAK